MERSMHMSRETPSGLSVVEKFLGLLIILIGVITVYATYINIGSTGPYPGIFIAAGVALIGLGIFIFVAKVQ